MAYYDYYEIELVEYLPQVYVQRRQVSYSTLYQVMCTSCGFIYESYSNWSAQNERRRHLREH